jgi:hypothetical protein
MVEHTRPASRRMRITHRELRWPQASTDSVQCRGSGPPVVLGVDVRPAGKQKMPDKQSELHQHSKTLTPTPRSSAQYKARGHQPGACSGRTPGWRPIERQTGGVAS